MNMALKRDDRGRPIGLDWPEQPPVEPTLLRKRTVATGFSGAQNLDGRPRQDLCGKGLHDMAVHGREIKGGTKGRYCNECKNERRRKTKKATQ